MSGIMYMFGIYSPVLKATFGLTQAQTDGLATATNVANNLAVWTVRAVESTRTVNQDRLSAT